MTDYFLYSGEIAYEPCLDFIDLVEREKTEDCKDVVLVLSTYGGDARAAYKIGRCLQFKYENVKIFVPGMCKSAGTILAIAAKELIFSPSGELGPLDAQMIKKDSISESESVLDMDETFKYLEGRSKEVFHDLVREIVQRSNYNISFQTASNPAAEIASSLFDQIFANINPDDIGKRTRVMQIAADYGVRLDAKFKNLVNAQHVLRILTEEYSSHVFPIDVHEAVSFFKNVRLTNEVEEGLVRHFRKPDENIEMRIITKEFQKVENKESENSRGNSKRPKDNQTVRDENNEESRDKA